MLLMLSNLDFRVALLRSKDAIDEVLQDRFTSRSYHVDYVHAFQHSLTTGNIFFAKFV